jgi:hypothetical protein
MMMKINKVEKKVPNPVIHSKTKYPWAEMEIGDSVLIIADKGQTLSKLKRRVGRAGRYYGQINGKKFKTLMMREENGVRTWRVE